MPAPRNPNNPSKVRTTRFTDDEWALVLASAERENKTPAQFLREATLGTAVSEHPEEILESGGAAIPPNHPDT